MGEGGFWGLGHRSPTQAMQTCVVLDCAGLGFFMEKLKDRSKIRTADLPVIGNDPVYSPSVPRQFYVSFESSKWSLNQSKRV